MTTGVNVDRLTDYVTSVRSEYERSLKALVDIPSVSMDPAHKADMHRAAVAARDLLQKAGAEAKIIETAGYPVIYGEMLSDPSHPTVAIYNHIDVQPADSN